MKELHPLPLYQGSLASMSSPDALGNARSAAAYRPWLVPQAMF